MARYDEREFKLGEFWLSQRAGSKGWCRTWYDRQAEQTRRIALGTGDFEEAKRRLEDYYFSQRLNHARHLSPGDVTLAEVFKEYFDNHGSKLRSAGTIKILLRYWIEFWTTATVSELKDVPRQEKFREFLFAKGHRQNSVNRCLEMGRAAVNRAHKRGLVASVPYIHCLEVENIRPMGRALSKEELAKLYWLGSEEPHFRLYLLLAMATGGRPEAIITLQWPQVDLKNGIITLNPEGRRQTSKRRPIVRLPPTLKKELKKLPKYTPQVIMFRGRPFKKLVSVWGKAKTRAKLKGRINAYSIRHSVASHLRASGVPQWEVSAQLGHRLEGYSMTERYTHLDPSYLRQSCEALDRLLAFVLASPLQSRASLAKKPLKTAEK